MEREGEVKGGDREHDKNAKRSKRGINKLREESGKKER